MIFGFSTGSIAFENVHRGLDIASQAEVKAVELSALREAELAPLIDQLGSLEGELQEFEYVSLHAPSKLEKLTEQSLIKQLKQVAKRGWAIIVHPDVIQNASLWHSLGEAVCIENMDKRKSTGKTAVQMQKIFEELPKATFCFDIGHARQIDPTMLEAAVMLNLFSDRLRQVHMSGVNSQSHHERLNFECIHAFQKVARGLNDANVPIILESPVHALEEAKAELQAAAQVFEALESLATVLQ